MISFEAFKSRLETLREEARELLSKAETREVVESLEVRWLGRKSELSSLLRLVKDMPRDDRARAGQLANSVRRDIVELWQAQARKFEDKLQPINVTLPGVSPRFGHEHLVSKAIRDISAIFARLGFERVRYPEVETDRYAFDALNMPPDEPARDEWETFFMEHEAINGERFILTPHGTSGTARSLATKRLPLRSINIQKCYRRQSDISHVPMFHHFDGVYADKGVTIQHLKGVLEYFVKSYFGADRKIRLRPFHFRFTEPSFEVDITGGLCRGKGCRVCKEGWVELGGSGMVHPQVMKFAGLNPRQVTALAFGWGVERCLLMRSDLPDMRILYENDIRFLEQF